MVWRSGAEAQHHHQPARGLSINASNTLIARYSYSSSSTDNDGVGAFSLPERAFTSAFTQQNIQLTETAVLNAAMINETKFQFTRNRQERLGDNSIPTLNVSSAFTSGGSQVGDVEFTDQRWELQNFLAWAKGNHALKFGGRVRGIKITDINPNISRHIYFYRFSGSDFQWLRRANHQPVRFADSLERYRRTRAGARLSGNVGTEIPDEAAVHPNSMFHQEIRARAFRSLIWVFTRRTTGACDRT